MTSEGHPKAGAYDLLTYILNLWDRPHIGFFLRCCITVLERTERVFASDAAFVTSFQFFREGSGYYPRTFCQLLVDTLDLASSKDNTMLVDEGRVVLILLILYDPLIRALVDAPHKYHAEYFQSTPFMTTYTPEERKHFFDTLETETKLYIPGLQHPPDIAQGSETVQQYLSMCRDMLQQDWHLPQS